jgi:hypothetical protein
VLERLRASVLHQPLERRHVYLDAVGTDADRVSLLHETDGRPAGQGPSERHESLTQAVAGALVGRVAPQERGQLVARLHASGMEREVGQQRLGLLAREPDRGPGRQPRFERPEQGDLESPHRCVQGL